jgi:hypothetical protein
MFARSARLQPSINHRNLRFGKHGAVAPWQFRVDMPRLNVSRPNLLRDRSLILAAGAALLVAFAPAHAQDAGLRGEIAENQIWQDIRARRSPLDPAPVERAQNNNPYAPESTGAVADETPESRDTTASLFPDPKADADTMGEPDEPDATPRGVRKRDEEPVAPEEPAAEEEEEGLATNTRAERIDAADEERNIRAEPENGRAEAIEGADIEPEDNPYAPLGLRVGTFNVTSTFEQGVTWTSNANYSPTPAPAFLSESALRLNAVSDWSRHSAVINAFGVYRKTIDGEEVTDPSIGFDATLNLDIREDLRAIAKAGYDLRPEAADSPVNVPGTGTRPLRHEMTGSLGVQKDVGKLRFAVTGEVERLGYDDAGAVSQEERNSTLFTGTLRTGYQISPALTPFVELEIGRRNYDIAVDSNGDARSSDRYGARLGTEIDLGEKLVGEVSAGWINEQFDGSALSDISGLTAEGDLTWSPERGTDVNFNASTTVEGTTTAGDSGSILYSGTVALRRELRSNLTFNGSLGASWREYSSSPDRDLTLRAETSLTWWLNRYAGITGRYRYEGLNSTKAGRDTTTNSLYLGVTLQR